MRFDKSPSRSRTLVAIAVCLFCSAVVGLVLGMLIVPAEIRGRSMVFLAFAVTGAMWGGGVGARIIRATGWMMLLGAILGGALAILVDGNGKAAIFGAPLGVIAGLACGQAIKRRVKKSADKTE